MKPPRGKYRNYWWLIPVFAAALLYQITYTIATIELQVNPSRRVNVPFLSFNARIESMDSSAKQAGLRVGDLLLDIDGQNIKGDRDLFRALAHHTPGTALTLLVASNDGSALRTVQIPPAPVQAHNHVWSDWVLGAIFVAVSMLCVLIGIYAAALLPNDARALSFFGLMLGVSGVVTNAQWFEFPQSLQFFAAAFFYAKALSWPLWIACFVLYFPERFPWDRKHPWIKWCFLAPVATLATLIWLNALISYYSVANSSALYALLRHVGPYYGWAIAAAITFFFAGIGAKIGIVQSKDGRRRLRILLRGSLLALTPLGLLVAWAGLAHRPVGELPEAPVIAACLLFCLFPVALAYAVVAEQAMDLRVVIRQGVRYTLAKGGLRLLLGLVAGGFLTLLSNYVFGSGMRRMGPVMNRDAEIAIYVVAVLIVVFLVRRTRSRLMALVDRKFFREAYNSQKILEELSESVHSMVDEDKMLGTVARQISESMHVPRFAVLLSDGDGFRPVYCLGFEAKPEVSIPENSKTVEVIKESKNGARVNLERDDNWVHSTSDSELLTIKALHAQLLLPLNTKDKLLGILSLGEKRSEEPYSASDVQILRSVSVQTALALENGRLTKAVATEIAAREKLNLEIEIAREVQERLFPQRLPPICGIDYYGACRPALGVGGDYYDFLALSNGDLGIAIGDVSGKGIAAALLMASLQASLRGQALLGQGDLAQLMTNVNQLVYDATPGNRYATFFYGHYHLTTRLFRYVNAGHNPPFVLRRTDNGSVHVIRLETGGTVVGLFPHAPYQEGALTLHPGDIFVGFTDGVSEAMNMGEEEWGEERMIPAVAAHSSQSAAEIIPSLMADADRFVAGAPQHDDMTLVVMKLSLDGSIDAQAKIVGNGR